jgi:tetratricopeptide (TPR) repeat protein
LVFGSRLARDFPELVRGGRWGTLAGMRAPFRRRRVTDRDGFIFFFGTRTIVKDESQPPVRTRCPKCEQEANLIARSHRQWFTIFFVPVFPISKKLMFSQCANCGTTFRVDPTRLKTHLDEADHAQRQRAITMYHSLRASPANAVTLNELMSLYASLNEFDAAIAAARDFPAALESSEQCMTTLGRVYLTMDRQDEAVEWFEKAIERNPLYAEAQYFKAVAHLGQSPPDLERAQSAARAARIGEHPNAELLMRDVEQKMRAREQG